MQNLKRYTDPDEIRAVLMDTFRTDMFKSEIAKGDDSLVGALVNEASERPLTLYDFNRYDLEGSHFTTWMGAIQRRPYYTNDYIHDLYWVHELAHFGTMDYDPTLSFAQWHTKMSENEYQSALLSEAFIYMMMPELREQTFEFEIWADRFMRGDEEDVLGEWEYYLGDGFTHDMSRFIVNSLTPATRLPQAFKMRSKTFFEGVLIFDKARRKAMMTPRPWDFVEMQISIFAKQNIEWTLTWQKSWRKVEAFMADMLAKHQAGEDTNDMYFDWLSENSKGSYRELGFMLPFREEAKVFSNILSEIHKRGGNQILESK